MPSSPAAGVPLASLPAHDRSSSAFADGARPLTGNGVAARKVTQSPLQPLPGTTLPSVPASWPAVETTPPTTTATSDAAAPPLQVSPALSSLMRLQPIHIGQSVPSPLHSVGPGGLRLPKKADHAYEPSVSARGGGGGGSQSFCQDSVYHNDIDIDEENERGSAPFGLMDPGNSAGTKSAQVTALVASPTDCASVSGAVVKVGAPVPTSSPVQPSASPSMPLKSLNTSSGDEEETAAAAAATAPSPEPDYFSTEKRHAHSGKSKKSKRGKRCSDCACPASCGGYNFVKGETNTPARHRDDGARLEWSIVAHLNLMRSVVSLLPVCPVPPPFFPKSS